MPDASDTTLRRKLQALNTNRLVLQEAANSGAAHRVFLHGRSGATDESQYLLFREAALRLSNEVCEYIHVRPQIAQAPISDLILESHTTRIVPESVVPSDDIRVALISSAFAVSYGLALKDAYLTMPHLHTLGITCYDLNNFDGAILTPDMYTVVVLYAPTVPIFHPEFGANLNAYIANGGNTVITQFLFGNANMPRIPGFDYSLTPITYNTAFAVINPETYFKPIGIHPITSGIDTYINMDAANIGKPILLQEGATIIATFTDRLGTPFIIVNSVGNRRSVAVNRHPRDPSLFTDTVYNQLIANSIVWVSGVI